MGGGMTLLIVTCEPLAAYLSVDTLQQISRTNGYPRIGCIDISLEMNGALTGSHDGQGQDYGGQQ